MGSFSMTHWMVVAVVVLVLFGGGFKFSSAMADVAKGLKSFKRELLDVKDEAEGAIKDITKELEKK